MLFVRAEGMAERIRRQNPGPGMSLDPALAVVDAQSVAGKPLANTAPSPSSRQRLD